MTLSDLVHREIIKITAKASITDAARMMRELKIGSIFVEEADAYVGIVTDSDLVRKAFVKDLPFETLVTQVMGTPLIEIDIDKSVMDANHLMYFNEIRHLAISEKERWLA